ncbi:hypothetical protein FHT76_008350 [Rhizobium sp. BK176]|nr:hypothetical protein [Rhizobium sp. BK181]MBB3545502.1 hypothetical protein [Rhizobium sp. BK399]MCS3744032.1 hypothetical protein [Rhizobium sp. BK661]MCS4096628.1 hypothetical protein [Rhizobium sp. BK176]
MCPTPEERKTLRRVLKRADYATSEMQAAEGDRHLEEVAVIRRIEAATIPTVNYPASKRQRLNADFAAVSAWENEGGSVRLSKRTDRRKG